MDIKSSDKLQDSLITAIRKLWIRNYLPLYKSASRTYKFQVLECRLIHKLQVGERMDKPKEIKKKRATLRGYTDQVKEDMEKYSGVMYMYLGNMYVYVLTHYNLVSLKILSFFYCSTRLKQHNRFLKRIMHAESYGVKIVPPSIRFAKRSAMLLQTREYTVCTDPERIFCPTAPAYDTRVEKSPKMMIIGPMGNRKEYCNDQILHVTLNPFRNHGYVKETVGQVRVDFQKIFAPYFGDLLMEDLLIIVEHYNKIRNCYIETEFKKPALREMHMIRKLDRVRLQVVTSGHQDVMRGILIIFVCFYYYF